MFRRNDHPATGRLPRPNNRPCLRPAARLRWANALLIRSPHQRGRAVRMVRSGGTRTTPIEADETTGDNEPLCRSPVFSDRVEPAASSDMVRDTAQSGSELSCRDTTGANTMTEVVSNHRPPVASRPRRKPATVSASALALHLDCSRTYIGKLKAEGVIQRRGDGFLLDQRQDVSILLPAA